jgi:hypothetical protein
MWILVEREIPAVVHNDIHRERLPENNSNVAIVEAMAKVAGMTRPLTSARRSNNSERLSLDSKQSGMADVSTIGGNGAGFCWSNIWPKIQ